MIDTYIKIFVVAISVMNVLDLKKMNVEIGNQFFSQLIFYFNIYSVDGLHLSEMRCCHETCKTCTGILETECASW